MEYTASEFVQVVTAAASKEEAQKIATALVEKRLAGCVQVLGPVTSTYWWQDQIETTEEWLCLMKTSQAQLEELEQTVRDLHSYEVPELLAIPVLAGSDAYLTWLKANLTA